jgi:hypothetical protein
MGYLIGKEASLQVTQGREPDLFGQIDRQPSASAVIWDYVRAAQQIHAEPGLEVNSENDLQNLTIRNTESGEVVTIVEVISPSNKVNYMEMQDYQHRRKTLRVEKNIHVVEIDLTRSIKRLVDNLWTRTSPYHIAVHVARSNLYVISWGFKENIPRFALPLRQEVYPVELENAYHTAYRGGAIAGQISKDRRYTETDLPFPSLLSQNQKQLCLQRVSEWQQALERLRN